MDDYRGNSEFPPWVCEFSLAYHVTLYECHFHDWDIGIPQDLACIIRFIVFLCLILRSTCFELSLISSLSSASLPYHNMPHNTHLSMVILV